MNKRMVRGIIISCAFFGILAGAIGYASGSSLLVSLALAASVALGVLGLFLAVGDLLNRW